MTKKSIFSKILKATKEHGPELMIGAGIASMITSTILAVRATPKALERLEDKKADLGVTYLTKKETVQAGIKPYIPSIITGAIGVTCIIGGTTKNLKKQSALAAVYAISENTLKEYKREVTKTLGEEKAREIEKKITKGHINERPVILDCDDSQYVENTGNGQTLFYDSLSGRYFRSSTNAVDRAINAVNKSLMTDMYISVNELYNEIGISTIGAGSLIGWSSEKDMVDIHYDTEIADDGQPYVVLYYRNPPEPLFKTGY